MRLRAGGAAATGVWLVVAGLTTAMSMILAATGGPGLRVIGPVAEVGRALEGLGAGRILMFAPVSPRILDDIVGVDTAGRLLADSRSGDSSGGTSPRPSPKPPPNTPSSPPRLSEQITSQPKLRITMSVDKSRAQVADTLTYTIVVTNVGRGIARQVSISSHVPAHTRFVSDDTCGDRPVAVRVTTDSSQVLCYGLRIESPTSPSADYSIGEAMLGPGRSVRRVFTVLIEAQTPQGTVIRNIAHVQSVGVPAKDSNEVSTVVG
ncbi:MAG: hypothetical protein WDA27_02665 [Actinomycetota bacterium]